MAAPRLALALGLALLAPFAGICDAQARAQVTAMPRIDIAPHVREASQRFGIPEAWIHAVIRIESAGRIRAVSSAGAMGLMQLMPGTWLRQRARFGLGADPFDPRNNILAGTSYLREMHDRYGAAGFLAAYNAGPGRYEEWRDRGRPLPLETRRYVTAIANLLQQGSSFPAAAMQPAGSPAMPLPHGPGGLPEVAAAGSRDASANPFARPAVPSHDLFAPVSGARDR